ncbi:unnamed protein product, partial [Staurois parvus]
LSIQTVTFYNIGLKPGHSVEVKGFIPEDCEVFVINLGTDGKNLVLHFCPRFNNVGDQLTVILNSKVDDVWGEEQRESFFPFAQGSDTTVCLQWEGQEKWWMGQSGITVHIGHISL